MSREFGHSLPCWSQNFVAVARTVSFRLLRKDQHAVGADVKCAVAGQAVAFARLGDLVATPMAFEPNQVAAQPKDAVVLLALIPIDRHLVAKKISLEEFLALEE